MRSADPYLAQRSMEMHVGEAHSQARARQLQRQAMLAQPRELGRRGRRLLGQIALLLVASGARLVNHGLPPYRASQAETSAGGRST